MTEFFKFTYYLLRFMIVHRQAIRMRRQIGRSGVFDAAYYVNHVPSKDQSTAKIWPIMHYLVIGEPRGYLPNPLFITDYYRNQLLRHQISEMPLWHFVNEGFNSWFRPNPQFDCRYYAAPDIILNKVNPLAHYYLHGWKENRDPSRTFSSKDYLNHHPELIITGENPLAHFLRRELSEPTELWGLPPGASLDSLKSQPELPVRARFTVELIVPVYRRPECVEDLFDSMLDSADWADVERCTVVDDCGDSFTSDYLKKLPLRDPKIVIQKNQTNLGFLRSCNQAFSQARADIVVLVNSDVRVPGNWLRRLCAPLELDQLVALSTPLATSGANLSFALRPGQSWRDVDGILNSKPATYPDACTAIGYLMAIRRSAVGTSPLFDEMYKHGYCEDTDLHYRFISNGLRSVICDNLGIYHQGGASYELDEKKAAIYEANRKIFFARWETLHQVEHARYVNASPLQSRLTAHGHTVEEMEAAVLDVLLVAPTNNTAIGGVKIIFQL
ncbi:MAG: glycosyltransferase, partial [Proteobacteria bacterium]|nr:glycosyltransferase [Pseudomonadota bacterium]